MTLSRQLAQAVRRFADDDTDRMDDLALGVQFIATVTTVTAGASKDGRALIKVTWRGTELPANGYSASYTPGVGDRVLCSLLYDGQLVVHNRYVGYPA